MFCHLVTITFEVHLFGNYSSFYITIYETFFFLTIFPPLNEIQCNSLLHTLQKLAPPPAFFLITDSCAETALRCFPFLVCDFLHPFAKWKYLTSPSESVLSLNFERLYFILLSSFLYNIYLIIS